ncbi:hypothetical protein Tco_0582472, partial [Tanacetum coccineum]
DNNSNTNKGVVIGETEIDGDISSPRDKQLQGGTSSKPIEGDDNSLTESHVPAIAKEEYLDEMDIGLLDPGDSFFRFRRPKIK